MANSKKREEILLPLFEHICRHLWNIYFITANQHHQIVYQKCLLKFLTIVNYSCLIHEILILKKIYPYAVLGKMNHKWSQGLRKGKQNCLRKWYSVCYSCTHILVYKSNSSMMAHSRTDCCNDYLITYVVISETCIL